MKSNQSEIKPNKYDICLISEPRIKLNRDFIRVHQTHDVKEYVGLVAQHTLKYCKKNNKNIIFSGKSDNKSINFQSQEKKFYEKILKDTDIKITFNNKKNLNSIKI